MTLAQRAVAAAGAGACTGTERAQRQAACTALLAQVHELGLQQVRVVWADLHGTLRGKTLVLGDNGAALRSALDDGVGMVSTMFLKDTSDRTAFKVFEPGALEALDGFGSANNALLLPDPTSLRVLPWSPQTAWLRADALWADGSPVLADPRAVLLRALAQLKQTGHGLRCGLEVEFHIYRISDDGLASEHAAWPAPPPAVRLIHPGYQLLSDNWADLAHEPLDIVRHTALGLGLPLQSLEIELGPSQVEAVFAPTDALTAADHMVLFRNGVRQALRRAGYHASFVCKPPLPHAVASGWHLHQSLVDGAGRNAMQRPLGADARAGCQDDARQVLSDLGAHWLAGLLQHAPGMAALCAPTVPAYERFRGSVMAPQAAHWARDNRGALLRVLGAPQDPATRIENRLGEPMANPHLMIAAQVWAGLDGLQQKLEPGLATRSPYDSAAPRLPGSLSEALDALATDDVLQQGLGPVLATVFDTVKRQELTRCAAAQDFMQWQRCEYFARY
jgi:glutamine synthetase